MKTTGCFCCFFVRTWFWGVIAGRRFFFTQFLPSCLPIVTRCVIRRRSVPRRRRRELGFFFFKLFFTFFLRSSVGRWAVNLQSVLVPPSHYVRRARACTEWQLESV